MVTVIQSPSDKKSYRYLKLDNGLSVLLIHDPAVAAALAAVKDDGNANGAAAADSDDPMGSGSGGNEAGSNGSDSDADGSSSSGDSGEGEADMEGSEEGSSDDEGEDDEEDDEGGRRRQRGGGSNTLGASKKAAAAMAVGVGSFSDPLEMQGLSHFLEHMLFMGSEKFPDENEYDNFLSKHGGGSNAFTELEFTNYHFDVSPASLEGALDRFAQFFVEPLFQAGSLEREVQAVDSEFKGVLQSDHSRLAQLMCHTCRSGHVYNKFSWGNLVSLWEQPKAANMDIRQHIIDYYRQQYGAARMSLVVLGGQELDTLQHWVQTLFGPIPRGHVGPPASFKQAGPPFEGRHLYVSPAVRDHHEVTVTFQLPCLRGLYSDKPEAYISHLVGHEGPGSLTAALKSRGWALQLYGGVDDDGYSANSCCYLFTVNIVLTESGLQAGPGFGLAPVGLLFQYIRLLTNEGPQRWVWEEVRAINEMKFRYLEEEDSCDLVTRLASTMGWVDPQHLLVADHLYQEWRPDKVKELLDHMQPTHSSYRIDLLTKSFKELKQQLLQQHSSSNGSNGSTTAAGVEFFVEPWFNLEAVRYRLPDSLTSSWQSADVSADLALPPHNPFIPTDFTLKAAPEPAPQQQQEQGGPAAAAAAVASVPEWMLAGGGRPAHLDVVLSTPPHMIRDEPGVRVWHKMSVGFCQPRVVAYFRLSSPLAASTSTAAALTELWLRLVEEALAEESYLADVAELHWSSSPEGCCGFEVRLDGFSHKLNLLAEKVFNCLARCETKAQSFPSVHEELCRRHRNALLKPSNAGSALRLQLLSGGPHWTHQQLGEALQGVKGGEQVKAFAGSYLSCCHLESLIMGNITAAEASNLCDSISNIINTAAAAGSSAAGSNAAAAAGGGSSGGALSVGLRLKAEERPQERCVKLPQGLALLHQAPALNPEEDNCCVEVYYQIGLSSSDLRLRVLVDLLDQVLFEPLYDTLRTKQQLGYTVSSGARLTHGVSGFCVHVVSAAFDAGTVQQRIEAFLEEYHSKTLAVMSDEEFSRHKSALTSTKLQRDVSLGQEGDRAWEQVFTTRYEFVSKEQEAALLQDITLAELQAFYATYLAATSPQRRKLCVQVIPTRSRDSKQEQQQQQKPRFHHVQHELGAAHAHGAKHHVHPGTPAQGSQHQHHVEAAAIDEGHEQQGATTAAAAVGDVAEGDTPKSKRVRQGCEPTEQQAAEVVPSGGQEQNVKLVADLEAYKDGLERFPAYQTVHPQLAVTASCL